MMKCARGARLFLLLCLVFSFSGCTQFKRGAVSEEKDPHFLEARKRAKAMDWDGAIEYFERALQNNPTNAAAHFELGLLYDRRKEDYGAAIYHYQRHAKLRPNTPSAERAEQNIIACKRELAKTVSYEFVPRDFQKEIERFSQTNAILNDQIAKMRAELARRPQYVTNFVTNFVQVPQFEPGSSSRLTRPAAIVQLPEADLSPEPENESPPPETKAEPPKQAFSTARAAPPPGSARRSTPPAPVDKPTAQAKPAVKSGKKHRVRPGDTLEAIARQYGVSVAALKAANPAARSGTRAGQEIVIPAR